MNRRQLMLHSTALIACLVAAPVLAQDSRDATKFVGDFAQKGIVEVLAANIANAEKQARFRELFKQYFDVPSIGRFVLGRYSRNVAPVDQQSFDSLFEDIIVYTWSRRFSEYNGQSLKVNSATNDGEDGAIVKSIVTDKHGEPISVDWRLRKRPEGYKGVDVIVAGVSMALAYRQEYTTVIAQRGGFMGLLTQLQRQVDELRKQQPA